MTQEPEHDNALDTEITSWETFSEILRENDRKLFTQMLNECRDYKDAISTRGDLFTMESMLMSLIFVQQKIIKELMKDFQGQTSTF